MPSTSGIANFNPQEGHEVRKGSLEGRHFVYTYRKWRRGSNSITWKAVIYKQYICFYATYPSCHITFCRRISVLNCIIETIRFFFFTEGHKYFP